MSIRLGIFASGSGSNAINIHRYFEGNDQIDCAKIYCNNPAAGIITKAFSHDIPLELFTRHQMKSGTLLNQLERDQIDLIVLAGFLWLVPQNMVSAYQKRIINIHPSLLPKYGGKGMYGMNVHEAVIDSGDKESGITIHLVDEEYDHGNHLFQAKTDITPSDQAADLAKKIQQLEHHHFPRVVEAYALETLKGLE